MRIIDTIKIAKETATIVINIQMNFVEDGCYSSRNFIFFINRKKVTRISMLKEGVAFFAKHIFLQQIQRGNVIPVILIQFMWKPDKLFQPLF